MPKLEYDCDDNGNILLEQGRTTWGPNGRDDHGFHWVCYDSEFYAELDDVDFWLPLPRTDQEEAA